MFEVHKKLYQYSHGLFSLALFVLRCAARLGQVQGIQVYIIFEKLYVVSL